MLVQPGLLMNGAATSSAGPASPVGQQLFTSSGNFVVPDGVTSICAVAIGRGGDSTDAYDEEQNVYIYMSGGGGGLAYSNDIPVTPGESLTVVISTIPGGITRLRRGVLDLVAAVNAETVQGNGRGWAGQVLRNGGRPAGWDTRTMNGAGAAGYTSDGQAGDLAFAVIRGGGGTSPYGGGAGAAQGAAPDQRGGSFGGGAGTGRYDGGPGCVRIIWGDGRAFPNTNTADV